MKLILILDHMARNNLIPPDSKPIESYGHKLIALFDATKISQLYRGAMDRRNSL